jgi:hypothetical protein
MFLSNNSEIYSQLILFCHFLKPWIAHRKFFVQAKFNPVLAAFLLEYILESILRCLVRFFSNYHRISHKSADNDDKN